MYKRNNLDVIVKNYVKNRQTLSDFSIVDLDSGRVVYNAYGFASGLKDTTLHTAIETAKRILCGEPPPMMSPHIRRGR